MYAARHQIHQSAETPPANATPASRTVVATRVDIGKRRIPHAIAPARRRHFSHPRFRPLAAIHWRMRRQYRLGPFSSRILGVSL